MQHTSPSRLHRRFTPFTLLLISINGMIGSAWLFAPLYAAKIAGPGALIAWLIGGLGTMVIALTFAELSVLLPVAGGTAQIPQYSHGSLTSFVMSWMAWLSALTMAPIEVQSILQYASNYFTSLTYLKQGVPVLSLVGLCWAACLMLLFCIINAVSYKGLMRSNFFIFAFKIIIILLTIYCFIQTRFMTVHFSGLGMMAGSSAGWQAILAAVATGGVAFAFTGFKHGVELAGETKHVATAIPIATVGSVAVCLLLYLGLQVAFIGVLSEQSLHAGWQHLSFHSDMGPFAGLAAGLGLFWLMKWLYVDAVVSPAGAALIYVTSTARILYAMGRLGYIPRWGTYLNKQGFPVAAILVNAIIGMCLFLPLSGWQAMVGFLVSGMVISYAMGPIALLCLRLERPGPRSFRLPAAYLICPLAFYFCNLIIYWTGWATLYKLAIAMGVGLLFFMLACLRGKVHGRAIGFKSGLWLFPYLGGLVLISYLGAFGGKQYIPFGWDFLVIGLFSLVIFYLAVKSRTTQLSLDPADKPRDDETVKCAI